MLSYVYGAVDKPLIGETIGSHLDGCVARWGDRPALIVREQQVRWSYRQLLARVEEFAAGLLALGLEPGDRVGIWSPNNAEWVVTQLATAKAGLILVNINPAYRLHELEYALNKVGCRALITATRFKTGDYVGMLRELAPELAPRAPRPASRCSPAPFAVRHPDRRPSAGHHRVRGDRAARRRRSRARLHATRRRVPVRRPDQHSVHQRDHRLTRRAPP